jgi:hypothetical protein
LARPWSLWQKESWNSSGRERAVRRFLAQAGVTPATLEEDLSRRDFTVNALAVSLNGPRFGELLDPHGGQRILRPASSAHRSILCRRSMMTR